MKQCIITVTQIIWDCVLETHWPTYLNGGLWHPFSSELPLMRVRNGKDGLILLTHVHWNLRIWSCACKFYLLNWAVFCSVQWTGVWKQLLLHVLSVLCCFEQVVLYWFHVQCYWAIVTTFSLSHTEITMHSSASCHWLVDLMCGPLTSLTCQSLSLTYQWTLPCLALPNPLLISEGRGPWILAPSSSTDPCLWP